MEKNQSAATVEEYPFLERQEKILAKVMLSRLVEKMSEELMPDTQCGFSQGRSTADMIFIYITTSPSKMQRATS